MNGEELLMHVNTGSVASYDDWLSDYLDSCISGEESVFCPISFYECISNKSLIPVVENENGDFVERR